MSGLDIPALKVLVVEDSVVFRELVKTFLEAIGVGDVMMAADGQEALERIQRTAPSMIICDWKMQTMTGVEMVRRLRAMEDETLARLPVLLVTGYVEEEKEALAREAGADGYLEKPISARSLLDAMQSALLNAQSRVKLGV